MEKVLISACLTGEKCKYNGESNYCKNFEKLISLCDLVLVCPEVFGGLKTPRLPSEIKNKRVYNKKGKDVTDNFRSGANMVLYIAKQNNVHYAVLKENSPSCGVYKIYNGDFNGSLIDGSGITTKLLKENNIIVFNEKEIDKLIELLSK